MSTKELNRRTQEDRKQTILTIAVALKGHGWVGLYCARGEAFREKEGHELVPSTVWGIMPAPDITILGPDSNPEHRHFQVGRTNAKSR